VSHDSVGNSEIVDRTCGDTDILDWEIRLRSVRK